MERKWWTLIAVCIATFILLLDITVVNVALPAIARDLKANFTDLQWVIDAYTLTLAAFLLMSGSLADQYGRRLDLRRRDRDLHRLLGGMRVRDDPADAQRRARGAGRRGRVHVRDRACADRRDLPAQSARDGARDLGRGDGAAVAIGPLIGGMLVDADQLAVDLLHQRPDRDLRRS